MKGRDLLESYLERETGLSVSRGGMRRSIDRFLGRRCAALDVGDVEGYVRSLLSSGGEELDRLLEAVTVPHSWFYRDAEQWEMLEPWLREQGGAGRELQVWVPACATGEDAYTVALLARAAGARVRVLGTDINGSALEAARLGRYGAWAVRDLPRPLRRGLQERADGGMEVGDHARAAVRFARHNLMHPPPPAHGTGGWDLVLCRNVLFYFAQPTAASVVRRVAEALGERGRLVLGASDMLHSAPDGFRTRRVAERVVIERQGKVPSTGHPPRRSVIPPMRGHHGPRTSSDAARRVHRPVRRPAAPLRRSSRPPEPRCEAPLQAVDRDPLDPVVRLRAGVALHASGDPAGAIAELRASLFLAPDLWPASVYLGMAYERTGRPEEARKEFTRAASTVDATRALEALPEELRAYGDELIALARHKSGRKSA